MLRYFCHHLIFLLGLSTLLSIEAASQPAKTLQAIMLFKPDSELSTKTDIFKSHLADLPVSFQIIAPETLPADYPTLYDYFQSIAEEHSATIVFLAQFLESGTNVYVSLPDSGTTLVRHIDFVDGETPAGRYEMAAVVVRGMVTAMTSGGEIGVHIPDMPEPDTPKKAEPEEETVPPPETNVSVCKECVPTEPQPSIFALRVGYGVQLLDSDFPLIHNFRVGISGRFDRFYLFLAYRVVFPIVQRGNDLSLMVSFHPMAAGVGMRIPIGKFELKLSAAPLVNVVSWKMTFENPNIVARSPERDIWFALSPSIYCDWHFSVNASLYLAISLDVYLKKRGLGVFVERTGDARKMFDTWRFNPMFQIGTRFGFGY